MRDKLAEAITGIGWIIAGVTYIFRKETWIGTALLMLGLILLAMAYGAALGHIVEVMVSR